MFKRICIIIVLVITAFSGFISDGGAYNLGDHTILHHYKNTSYRLTKKPTLWQVTHEFPRGTHMPISYELLVVYPNANSHPTLHFKYGPHRFQVTTTKDQLKRVLSISEASIQQPEDTVQSFQKTFRTLLPFGTFDQLSVFPNNTELNVEVFKGIEEMVFTGQLKITDGYPIWQFGHPTKSDWLIEMKRHVFFPSRVLWNGRHRSQSIWKFDIKQDYQPWGALKPEISQIVFEQMPVHTDVANIRTTWTLLKTFQKDEMCETWLSAKQKTSPDATIPILDTQRLRSILASY